MYALSVLLASALALGASANPLSSKLSERNYGGACLTESEANTVANNFRKTIAEPFDVAFVKSTFSKTFVDYSDSVNELINGGCPDPNEIVELGSPTFSSRKAFIQGQSGQSPITFNILNVWHNCDTVILRWNGPTPGFPVPGTITPQEPVTGIIVLEVVEGNAHQEPWVIQTTYSEFNSGAWLYDLGTFVPPQCPPPPPPTSKRSLGGLGGMLPGRMA